MTDLEIRIFLTVVRTGSISGAAQALFVTQPAVSRRLRALEEELGYPLLERGKGVRRVELTDRGRAFIQVAEKWQSLWQETREIACDDREQHLILSSVGSVCVYLLPGVFRLLLDQHPGCSLTFHNYHSLEAYGYVEDGQVDLALISDDMYAKGVETIPAFREPMVLLSSPQSGYPLQLHPSQLKAEDEIRLPWNPEYDLWHGFWFSAAARPRAVLDHMALLEDFFSWGSSWAIMPLSAARSIAAKHPATLHTLRDGPPDRIIYYLQGRKRKPELTARFLSCLHQVLSQYPEIESYLA